MNQKDAFWRDFLWFCKGFWLFKS